MDPPISRIPKDLSFYVRIEHVGPDYDVQAIRCENGFGLPPKKRQACKPGDSPTLFLRWRILPIPENDEVRNITLVTYRTATVFTQQHDTQHLLAVPFDPRARHVRDHGHGWRPISFDHSRIGNTNNYYSHVGTSGQEQRVAAPAQPFLLPQLLPH